METKDLPVGSVLAPVFYTQAMAVDTNSFSPSSMKAKLIVQDWLEHALPIEILEPFPATHDDLCQVHDPAYVAAVFSGEETNGFGDCGPAIAEACLYNCGSMVSAALHALQHRTISCSPSFGFHLAGYAVSGGYCTFNGLALAAYMALRAGAKRIAILDCDPHDGSGTRNILHCLRFGTKVTHFSMGSKRFTRRDVQAFYCWLEAAVKLACDSCDLILYQAGADAHVNGPRDGFLIESQLWKRDSIVFQTASMRGTPVAWNLAGGYQREGSTDSQPVLEIHRNTMLEAANAMDRIKRDSASP